MSLREWTVALPLVIAMGVGAAGCHRSRPLAPAQGLAVKLPLNLTVADEAPPVSRGVRRVGLWKNFDGQLAYAAALKFVALGPREAGSKALEEERGLISDLLDQCGWQVTPQTFQDQDPSGQVVAFTSLSARYLRGPPARRRVLVAAHLDTERSRVFRSVGATEGAAGPAVLLEMARVLTSDPMLAGQVELWFLDGHQPFRALNANDGLFGSRFAAQMIQIHQQTNEIRAMVCLGNFGGKDFRLHYAPNSDPQLEQAFRRAANGVSILLAPANRPLLNDHIPFQQANVPAIAILDAEAPYLHTADDSAEQLEADSLAKVGQLVLYFLSAEAPPTGT
ncbi:MAG TPA: M28 family peptidase [Chthoniobacterales bacterium]